jgi:hypothetical protein
MGDGADDLYEQEMFALENRRYCKVHRCWYVEYGFGCPVCEDPDYPLGEEE